MADDETAHASLAKLVDLETADAFLPGWKELVMIELDQMRREMPYADTLRLTLACERRVHG